jgi:hypothetical protein
LIKKALFADQIAGSMDKILASSEKGIDVSHLDDVVAYLDSAAEIFQDLGMDSLADGVLDLLIKVAGDPYVSGLSSSKMTDNLKDYGTVFNAADDELLVSDQEELQDFEDEKD